MTSYTGGSSWPPYSLGQDNPKKPAWYKARCHSPCRAQYSSPELGNSLACTDSHERSRSRNAASSGESRKSNVDLLQLHGPQLGGRQCSAQKDMRQAVPGVTDAAMHLHSGLTHGPRSVGAVDFRDAGG